MQAAFFSYDADALANVDYVARKPGRSGEPRGLLTVESLLGSMVYDKPTRTAHAFAAITRAGIVAEDGERCIWVSFQPDIRWTRGKLRCGDLLLREPTDGGNALPVFKTRKVDGVRWHRVLVRNDGTAGWVEADVAAVKFTQPYRQYAPIATRYWARVLFDEPGGEAAPVEFNKQVAFTIKEVRRVDGRTWLRVRARADFCVTEIRKELGHGWVPLRSGKGRLNVYYDLSC